MKKNILLVGMLVLLLMFVSACSGTASKGSSSDSASEKTEMRTYKSPKGTSTFLHIRNASSLIFMPVNCCLSGPMWSAQAHGHLIIRF